jgi:hypothetical protein
VCLLEDIRVRKPEPEKWGRSSSHKIEEEAFGRRKAKSISFNM